MEENPVMAHKIVLNNRNLGNLTGILDVISFDENSIVLDTDMGLLTIKGKDLHVNRLSLEKGEIDIEGRTDSLVYSAGGGKAAASAASKVLRDGRTSATRKTAAASALSQREKGGKRK
mgnify:CR=1 FL=1